MIKYPPLGRRGCALSRGHTDFQAGTLADPMASANEEVLLVIQIETQESVETIEEIVAVPGVDIVLIGPSDLSIALGVAIMETSGRDSSRTFFVVRDCNLVLFSAQQPSVEDVFTAGLMWRYETEQSNERKMTSIALATHSLWSEAVAEFREDNSATLRSAAKRELINKHTE